MLNLKAVSILILSLALTTIANADTIVLGAYQGNGTLAVTQKDEDGSLSAYNTKCHIALDIALTETSFDIPFGAITCDDARNSWNEKAIHLDVIGSKLFLNQHNVGNIALDGTISFELNAVQTSTVTIQHIDSSCRLSHVENKNYTLANSLTYTLKPVTAKSYSVSRKREVDTLKMGYKKEWPNCPAGTFYAPMHETRVILSPVTKQ